MDECRSELCELDLHSDSASLSCTRISVIWHSRPFLNLDLYPGSQQTGYDLDFYTGSHQTGCAFRYRQNAQDADITCYPAYRAVEWLTCYPASPAEVSELLASNKIEQSRAH